MASKETAYVVRILKTDLNGENAIVSELTKIKGVGLNFALGVLKMLGIPPHTRVVSLTEKQIKAIEEVLLGKRGSLPSWMLNRRFDRVDGKDKHLLGSDWDLQVREDIELMKRIKCWKGVRHALGLKVRGQRTRTTGRKGITVGVVRKK